MISNTRELLSAILILAGADRTNHSSRSLLDHLLGTYDILRSWKCEESVCIAGGLHSIYGTNVFKKDSLSISARPILRNFFSEEAEELAWRFGSVDRPRAIENGFGIDWRMGKQITFNGDILRKLRLIEAANLLEQGSDIEKWPNIYMTINKMI
jgi:hypothetical protein